MRRNLVGRPLEVLLVEDNLPDAGLTIQALKDGQVKHHLTLVRNGVEALDFLYQRGIFSQAPRPDLILLDLALPKLDGRDVLLDVKSNIELVEIPVVIMTASQASEDLVRSEMLRVDGYVTKPLDLPKFLALVRDLRRFWHDDVILPC